MKPRKTRTFLSDAVDMVSMASRAIECDDFSECFRPVPQYLLNRSGALYIFSFFSRYLILFPLRLALLVLGVIALGFYFILALYFKSETHISNSFFYFFRLFMLILNCHVKHYGNKFRIDQPHIYVSNHSSFIDFMVLSSYKFCHACIAENHGGLYGFIFNSILSKNGCISFKRSEKTDRETVIKKVKNHIKQNKTPMLIFPEGTCVNNKYTVLFQKGAFELDAIICPVAIKYSKDLMDPYWNRRIHDFSSHLFYLMTRWRIDAEIHWMEPVKIMEDENPIQFGHRVKTMISRRIKLKNTLWNGYFKSSPVLKDREIFRDAFKMTYVKQKYKILGKDTENDLKNNRIYLLDENVDMPDEDNKVFFNALTYSKFIVECCKEYLRLKENYSDSILKEFIKRLMNRQQLELLNEIN